MFHCENLPIGYHLTSKKVQNIFFKKRKKGKKGNYNDDNKDNNQFEREFKGMGLAKLSTSKAERKANQIKVSKLMRYQREKPKVEDELAPSILPKRPIGIEGSKYENNDLQSKKKHK